jgi:4-hydroxy 2-oxovalerate aldolase
MIQQNKKTVTVLDCTLRDGGYCNNWQFSKELARSAVESLDRAGVNIIELGYKNPSRKKIKTYDGLFNYCTESQLKFLHDIRQVDYACMVDTKEFLTNNSLNHNLIDSCIPPKSESIFSWIRIASYYPNLEASLNFSELLKILGYRVTINLMGISLLDNHEVDDALSIMANGNVDVFYFSDSFGDLGPKDVENWINRIRENYTGKIGIHTHDNNGLAFANTVAAINAGIDFIDSTIMGMGRGAGNLRTEQILLYLYFKKNYHHLNPSVILEVMDAHFVSLHNEFKWGYDYTYMLSAMQNIHPTYCQNLRASNLYTIGQVSKILNSIDLSERSKFSEDALLRAVDDAVNEPLDTDEPVMDIPLYIPKKGKDFLILASGPNVDRYQDELTTFIVQNQPVVIQCNPKTDVFEKVSDHYFKTILNWVRLKKALDLPQESNSLIVTGLNGLPKSYSGRANIEKFPCHVGKKDVAVYHDRINLPAYDVGMFTVGLSTLSNPKTIYTAGFDGLADEKDSLQKDMNLFWERINAPCPVISLTPTTYAIEQIPIYRLIK